MSAANRDPAYFEGFTDIPAHDDRVIEHHPDPCGPQCAALGTITDNVDGREHDKSVDREPLGYDFANGYLCRECAPDFPVGAPMHDAHDTLGNWVRCLNCAAALDREGEAAWLARFERRVG